MHKLENISLALDLIKRERIKLVNIGTKDIADGNMRIILGLIWTLIRHYNFKRATKVTKAAAVKRLSVQSQEVVMPEVDISVHHIAGADDLLAWCQEKLPEYKLTNLTSDWNDGRALCGLVNALRPGTCPDHFEQDPKDSLHNATLGLQRAERELGVAPLLLPVELTHKKVDIHNLSP